MSALRSGVLVFACAAAAWAQNFAPVINPRGVVNAYSQQPAPSQVGAGSIIWINGLNLGPPAGAQADGPTWPTELGGVQVLVNNRPAPLGSVSPARIVAQVPFETPNGLANIVVRRGEQASRPARITVFAVFPVLRTAEDKGFGEVAGAAAGANYTFTASGLGLSDPRVNTGESASAGAEARPRQAVSVFLGGTKVDADIKVSARRPGDFDISLPVPDGALPGDILFVQAANRLSNYGAWRRINRPDTTFVPMPDGAPTVRAMAASDLTGGFLIASAARTTEGCYPSVLFDLRAKRASNISQCLTAANQNAATPAVPAANASSLAALIGPPQGEPGQGVSNKVAIFQASKAEALTVDLPSNAAQVTGNAQGGFNAVMPGTPPQVANIDSTTGEFQLAQGGGGGAQPAGGAGGAAINPLTLQVDLGGGLDKLLSAPANTGPGQFSIVVGNDLDNPTEAKLAVINPQGEVASTRDFPDGFLPMVMPNPPAQPAPGGGGAPGGGAPGGGGPVGGGQGGGGIPAEPSNSRSASVSPPSSMPKPATSTSPPVKQTIPPMPSPYLLPTMPKPSPHPPASSSPPAHPMPKSPTSKLPAASSSWVATPLITSSARCAVRSVSSSSISPIRSSPKSLSPATARSTSPPTSLTSTISSSPPAPKAIPSSPWMESPSLPTASTFPKASSGSRTSSPSPKWNSPSPSAASASKTETAASLSSILPISKCASSCSPMDSPPRNWSAFSLLPANSSLAAIARVALNSSSTISPPATSRSSPIPMASPSSATPQCKRSPASPPRSKPRP